MTQKRIGHQIVTGKDTARPATPHELQLHDHLQAVIDAFDGSKMIAEAIRGTNLERAIIAAKTYTGVPHHIDID